MIHCSEFFPGSARASRAGEGALALANFSVNAGIPPKGAQSSFRRGAEESDQVAAATAPR
jgi:hypothetical protein